MDHVEECPSYYVDCWGTICDCDYMHICMCRELLACEERVRSEEQQRIEAALKFVGQHDAAWELAVRDRALRDAREAVEAVNWFNDEGKMLSAVVATANSISAIDALRKGNQP